MFLMSLAMAVVYSTYIRRQQKQLKKEGKVTNRGLKAAFAILQSAPAPPDPPPEEGFCDRGSMVSALFGVKLVSKKQQAHLLPCLPAFGCGPYIHTAAQHNYSVAITTRHSSSTQSAHIAAQ